jgi:hypothetical protein
VHARVRKITKTRGPRLVRLLLDGDWHELASGWEAGIREDSFAAVRPLAAFRQLLLLVPVIVNCGLRPLADVCSY